MFFQRLLPFVSLVGGLVEASPLSYLLFKRTPVPTAVSPSCQVLNVGKNPTAGQVCMNISGTNVVVTYSTVADYTYKEVQVWFGTGVPPTTAPGQFPYTFNNGYCTIAQDKLSATCTIPLSKFADIGDVCSTTFSIAAHAALDSTTGGKSETGWGAGTCINDKCAPWASYSTFTFVCSEPPPPPPPAVTCNQTGYGYVAGSVTTLNSITGSKNWGWQITANTNTLANGPITGDIYIGAGGNDITKGTDVGSITISQDSNTKSLTITYTTTGIYDINATHVYIGNVTVNKSAPGQYGFQHSLPGNRDTTDTYVFTTASKDSNGTTMAYLATANSNIYLALHAEIYYTC